MDSDPKEVYFNLYGIHCDPSTPLQWEKIAGSLSLPLPPSLSLTLLPFSLPEDWHPLALKFTPFQLTHTKYVATHYQIFLHYCCLHCWVRVLAGDQWESVFLLAGDDLSVHMYREYLLTEVSVFKHLTSSCFPSSTPFSLYSWHLLRSSQPLSSSLSSKIYPVVSQILIWKCQEQDG